MKRRLMLSALLISGLLGGCGHRQANSDYNPRYDGLSGRTLPAVNRRILHDQADLAGQQGATKGSAGGR